MKHAVMSGLLCLASTACSVWAGPPTPAIEPGQAFSLRLGEGATMPAAGLHIRFEAVLQDSRCPRGERCMWAGDATVRLALHSTSAGVRPLDLSLAAGHAPGGSPAAAPLRLLRLDPVPITGRVTTTGDYVATLIYAASLAADPSR